MGFGRALILLLVVQTYGFIKHRTVLHKDSTAENYIQKVNLGDCRPQLNVSLSTEKIIALI